MNFQSNCFKKSKKHTVIETWHLIFMSCYHGYTFFQILYSLCRHKLVISQYVEGSRDTNRCQLFLLYTPAAISARSLAPVISWFFFFFFWWSSTLMVCKMFAFFVFVSFANVQLSTKITNNGTVSDRTINSFTVFTEVRTASEDRWNPRRSVFPRISASKTDRETQPDVNLQLKCQLIFVIN